MAGIANFEGVVEETFISGMGPPTLKVFLVKHFLKFKDLKQL